MSQHLEKIQIVLQTNIITATIQGIIKYHISRIRHIFTTCMYTEHMELKAELLCM